MKPLDAPNINYLWTTLMIEELVRNGVMHFVVSPGSRSTPLTLAVAEHPLANHTIHYDERGAAFYALGMAKVTGNPVALVCTSGSAVANYLPAVVEASQSNVPLLLLTADRPPELLNCGANQAIDQQRIFGDYTRWYTELPCPTEDIDPAFVLTTMDQAVHRSRHPHIGPVHVNCHFREPLAPKKVAYEAKGLERLEKWAEDEWPYSTDSREGQPTFMGVRDEVLELIFNAKRGLLVIGPSTSGVDTLDAGLTALQLGWPIWVDVAGKIYNKFDGDYAESEHFDVLLKSEEYQEAIQPDVVLHLGGPLVSKRALEYFDSIRPTYVHLTTWPEQLDAMHYVTHFIRAASINSFLICEPGDNDLEDEIQDSSAADSNNDEFPTPDPKWSALNECISQVLDTHCAQDTLSEISVARHITQACPEGGLLYLGNSMPVRDVDMFGDPNCKAAQVLANRGASGIDGNIASALGAAQCAECTTLLLGDLATLHDLNSLALARDLDAPFILVVINNDGGGIFSFLPVAEQTPHFESHFGTPHGMNFEHAAAQFGLDYVRPETMCAFRDAYAAASTTPGATLIEVCTDRAANKTEHEQVQQAMIEAAEQFLKENK